MKTFRQWIFTLLVIVPQLCFSQASMKVALPDKGGKILLHENWFARRANEIGEDGNLLTLKPFQMNGWIPAKVPGTALTTLLHNKLYDEPEFGLNNEKIPDIAKIGKDFYTFWYFRQFEVENLKEGEHIWLNFRGINYKAEIYLNGKRLNAQTHEGMFLRQSYEITEQLKADSINQLAVLVLPPDYVGEANGGQGGDGMIARNCTMQYTPGWDWIQPVKDRNTGIWDEVSLTTSGDVRVMHPYVATKVPGVRTPHAQKQADAFLESSVELQNVSDKEQKGILALTLQNKVIKQPITLAPHSTQLVNLKKQVLKNPALWWPNGIGEQPMQEVTFSFECNNKVSDQQTVRFGIREIELIKNKHNGGREFHVNGQRIYITGGNYINSDWLLRLSPERYDHEVRFHAEMNVRMIRVWGGALLERPEFYAACDKYGILVFQDLWGSGDCNGAWLDPMKRESRERRWEYPDNHPLFLRMAEDQIKMVRNHPSLCFWCGANEWPLAKDIDKALKTDLIPRLDPNRYFASYSTDSAFTRNLLNNNGDGPYGICEPEWFFTFRSHPFNPEMGSVGSPEIESFKKFMDKKDMDEFPINGRARNGVWRYHRDLGYGNHLERYGEVKSIEDYCKHAQVVNYDQYRSFMEGWASHIWDWYTGILIWKTQNPWTSLRGQMYDWYLDVNASLYGTRKGCEPIHPFFNRATQHVELLNTSVEEANGFTVKAEQFNREGKIIWSQQMESDAPANQVKDLFEVPTAQGVQGVYFLKLSLLNKQGKVVTDNIYWLTTTPKNFTSLKELPNSTPQFKLNWQKSGNQYKGTLRMKGDKSISFFNRVKVFDKETGELILPVHYSDNYITLMPGDEQSVTIDFVSTLPESRIDVVIESWTSQPIHVSAI